MHDRGIRFTAALDIAVFPPPPLLTGYILLQASD